VRPFQKLRSWFHPEPADAAAVAEAKRMGEDNVTIRSSQAGSRQPWAGLAPTPDVLDPDRERHPER
jgi:hypothetical protein